MMNHHQKRTNNCNLKIQYPILKKREIILQMENKKINNKKTQEIRKINKIIKRKRKHQDPRQESQRQFSQKTTAAANNLQKKNQMNKKNTIPIF